MTLPSHRSFIAVALLACPLAAQCDPQWQPGDPLAYASGSVGGMTTWDPDGAGPMGPQLVVGGSNLLAGSMVSKSIVAFDGTQWLPLGTPPAGFVTAVGQYNGLLVASFRNGSGISTLASWNGTAWQTLVGVGGTVKTMATYNGDLIIGGSFAAVTGVAANNIARWDGTSWSPLGSGVVGDVRALAVYSNLLHVGGNITQAGGVSVGNLAAWNGSSFAATASFNGTIEKLGVYNGVAINSSRLIAAGSFTSVGAVAAQHIARFSPATISWSAIGAGLPGTTCTALFVVDTGLSYELTVGVDNPGSPQKVWNTQASLWIPLGSVTDTTGDVTPSSLSYFGGRYMLGLVQARVAVRKFLPALADWTPLFGRGIDNNVYAVQGVGNDIVIGGAFQTIAGVTMNGIARGTSNAWQPLGAGVSGGFGVFALTTLSNGDVIAGGSFTTAGGSAASNVARWNGTTWAPLGTGTNGTVYALRTLVNGDVVAAGNFTLAGGIAANRVARWNGSNWQPLGTGTSAQVNALAVMSNGDLVAGGNFLTAGGIAANRVARWNGTSWAPLGSGLDNAVFALAAMPNGDLVVGGHFSTAGGVSAGRIARWNGSAWSPGVSLFGPNGDVFALAALPDGDLIAGGVTWQWGLGGIFGLTVTNLARDYDSTGLNWSGLPLDGLAVYGATTLANGDLIVVGDFQKAGGLAAGNVARLAATCPAQAVPYGAGCTGSGGPNVLTATQLPWTGSTFRGRATGMPAIGFAVAVTGFAVISLPILAVLPQGLPGCNVLASPDLLDVVMTSAGSVASQLVLPDTVSLAGQLLYHQVAPFALDLVGSVTEITSTNGLLLTIGTF